VEISGDADVRATSNGDASSGLLDGGAGIGLGYITSSTVAGDVIINGGTVTATGGPSASGIGSGEVASLVSIEISGGNVNALGGLNGPGISGGNDRNAKISIVGGIVTATGAGKGAGIGRIENEIEISGTAKVYAFGGDTASGNGGPGIWASRSLNSSAPRTLVIRENAEVIATGGRYAAGIGTCGGVRIGDSVVGNRDDISIEDSAKVTATGGYFGAGIGSGKNAANGAISIMGTAHVIAVGGYRGAGIGSGGKMIPMNAQSFGAIIIQDSAQVASTGGEDAAGIGSGYDSYSGDIFITGSADVTSTGGSSSSTGGGSGIGSSGGATQTSNNISILSGTVVATGGSGNSMPGAGIGGNTFSGAITIGALADIKAYSVGKHSNGTINVGAIHASIINGDGYFVNAIFPSYYGEIGALKISSSTLELAHNEVELPEGFKSFAYTTGGSSSTDRIYKESEGLPIKNAASYMSDNFSEEITSSNFQNYIHLRFLDFLSTHSVTQTSAELLLTSYTRFEGLTFFNHVDYWPSGSEESKNSLSPWRNPEIADLYHPFVISLSRLIPNTLYEAQAFLEIEAHSLQEPISTIISFSTLPKIESASAGAATWISNPEDGNGEPVLSVPLSFCLPTGNIEIKNISISFSDATVILKENGSIAQAWTIDTDDGVSTFSGNLLGMNPGVEYDIVVEIENEEGESADYTLTHTPNNSNIIVSVPVKIIFAAFKSGEGAVTSPVYQLENHSYYPIDVSVASFIANPESLQLPELQALRLSMDMAENSPFSNAVLYDSGAGSGRKPLGALEGLGGIARFTIGGSYGGNFPSIAAKPQFTLEFLFELII
jgi:hypothetical protein